MKTKTTAEWGQRGWWPATLAAPPQLLGQVSWEALHAPKVAMDEGHVRRVPGPCGAALISTPDPSSARGPAGAPPVQWGPAFAAQFGVGDILEVLHSYSKGTVAHDSILHTFVAPSGVNGLPPVFADTGQGLLGVLDILQCTVVLAQTHVAPSPTKLDSNLQFGLYRGHFPGLPSIILLFFVKPVWSLPATLWTTVGTASWSVTFMAKKQLESPHLSD